MNNHGHTLALKNAHPRDQHIRFVEQGHTYFIGSDSDYTSVTTYLKILFSEFNEEEAAINAFKNNKSKNSNYKNMSIDEIKEKWTQDKNKGTVLHKACELFYNQVLPQGTPHTNHELLKHYQSQPSKYQYNQEDPIAFSYFMNFVIHNPDLKAFRTEMLIYHEELRIAGSIDILFKNDDGTVSIYDWKRSNNLSSTSNCYNRYGLLPFMCHIPETKYWKYALQLNLYKFILESKYNFTVKDMFMVKMHPCEDNYVLFQIPDLSDEIEDLVEYRLNTSNNSNTSNK